MDERARRIIDTAIELAERDGYAAVRLREVAAKAEVALGTVYKRFASKEEILVAAMAQEAERLLARFSEIPPGETPAERVVEFYRGATAAFLRRPKLARAILRAIAAGEGMTARVASIHALTTALLMGAITGERAQDRRWDSDRDKDAREVASIFMQVWFASLVGWSSGMHDEAGIVKQIENVANRVL
ncbi:MAG: TetR/AcrR family transcriptional regulator [Deltaproteobacteria bacterium]|nr:TetR/AcrR family transcriptional regulator [Deltaproteobacteria bacterium]